MDVNYLIMPWGRVGSHLLIDVIRQSSRFSVFKEPETDIMTHARNPQGAQRLQSQLWDSLGVKSRSSRVICNVNLSSVVDPDEFSRKARRQRGSLIYLDRRNVLKTAVSILKARLYAEWHKEQWGAPAWAVKERARLRSVADVIDVGSARTVLTKLISNREAFHAWRRANPGPLIYYEDMQIDLHGVIRYVCQELNIDVFKYEVRHFKAVDDNLRAEIGNFEEIGRLVREEFPFLAGDLPN
jgi:hypothetical protein